MSIRVTSAEEFRGRGRGTCSGGCGSLLISGEIEIFNFCHSPEADGVKGSDRPPNPLAEGFQRVERFGGEC